MKTTTKKILIVRDQDGKLIDLFDVKDGVDVQRVVEVVKETFREADRLMGRPGREFQFEQKEIKVKA